MFRSITEITITQNSTGRNSVLNFNFVNEFSAEDSWEDLTNTAKITFPKNIFFRDKQNNLVSISGTNNKIDELFRRGDKVEIKYGYYAKNETDKDIATIFKGFISLVNSKQPIEIECEDNMWLLKQIPCKPQTWSKDKTVEDLLKSLLSGIFTVNALTKTTVGDLVIQDESVAQLLQRLRKDFNLEAYFRGDELRIGSVVYIESEAVTHNFVFQQNIISDELEFQRKDDVKLSVICESINTKNGGQNKAGQTKTTQERLSVLVFVDSDGIFHYTEKKKDVDFPANEEGERRKLFFPNVTNAATLAQAGVDEMNKYYYTGFKGSFTTFGIPFVKQGDNVRIKDKVLPDRDGLYKVKGVKYSGGVNGQRQVVYLHYKMVEVNNKVQKQSAPTQR